MTEMPKLLKLKLDCRHFKETRVFYDPAIATTGQWVNRMVYCTECRKICKVLRVVKPIGDSE
jgi:hypothetical protein